jgi:hypothetical protein
MSMADFAERHRRKVFAALSKPVPPDELVQVVAIALAEQTTRD